MNRVTADSNIWVSALVFGGKPMQLLDSPSTVRSKSRFPNPSSTKRCASCATSSNALPNKLQKAERFITVLSTRVEPTVSIKAVPTDADDDRVLECAVAAPSDTIVTGDTDLLRMGSFRGIKIQRVADFLAEFQARGR